jgi:hypothetical protein
VENTRCNNQYLETTCCTAAVQSTVLCNLLYKNIKIKIYRILTLFVVLCGCENWSVTLREEHRLRVLRNRVLREVCGQKGVLREVCRQKGVLREVCGHKREEVTGG